VAVNREFVAELNKKGGKGQDSSIALARELVEGFEELGEPFDLITGYSVPDFRTYDDIIIPRRQWSHREGNINIDVSFLNLPYINRLSKGFSMRKEALKWAKRQKNDIQIFVYCAHSPFLMAAVAVKKKYPSAKLCVMIGDLPQYMDGSMSAFKKFLKKIDYELINKYLNYADSLVFSNKAASKVIQGSSKNIAMVEGVAGKTSVDLCSLSGNKKILLYSGALGVNCGIQELLDIFMRTKGDDYELWFTGKGVMEGKISEASQNDARIRYIGYLDTQEELHDIQRKATAFASVRPPDNLFSKYSFPSKIMEYLPYGRPILAFKSEGIPDEYDDFLTYMNFFDYNMAAKTVSAALETEHIELEEKKQAIELFLQSKNKKAQAKKILELFRNFDGL